jgi:hypothetical protein
MRVEVLSEYPDVMLADAERERRRGVAEQVAQMESLREERSQARADGRWLAWLRLASAMSSAKREAKRQHVTSALPTAREQAMRAGRNAERRVADQLAETLDNEWVLLRGYCNSRGEIDALLLGPRGLFAIEEKYRSVRVDIRGDEWMAQQIGRNGKSYGARFPIQDGKGRSPSKQVKEPAAALSRWLSTSKRGTPVTPVVLLTHPSARIGSIKEPTVRVERSVRGLLALIERSQYTLDTERRADVERLICRDHEFHKARKPSSEQDGRRDSYG